MQLVTMFDVAFFYLFTNFGVFTFSLCFAFCWYQWEWVRAYSSLPSKRLDTKHLLPIILGRYPRDVPTTSYVFQVLQNAVIPFREQGLCVLWFLKPYVFVYSEEHMKNLISGDGLKNKASFYDINSKLFGNGLIASKYEVWKVHRKIINPAFKMGVLKGKMNSFNKYAVQLAEKLEMLVEKPVDNVWEHLKYCAFQNLADYVFGLQLNDEKHITLAENFLKVVEAGGDLIIARYVEPSLMWDFALPFSQSGRKCLKLIHEIKCQTKTILRELKKTYVQNKHQNDSEAVESCGRILLEKHLQDPSFTEKDVLDELLNFAAAGFDTVSVAMLFCFYTLGHHLEVQEKVYNEIKTIVPDGDITYEHLAKLKYLDCVIKETLRLYPTVPLMARNASQDIQSGKYTIPKGTEIIFFIYMLHRDPNLFPDPEKFDPERFMDSSKLRPWMYVPFSEGERNCIGKRFSQLEMKVSLAHVLRRLRITSLDKIDDCDLGWGVILYPLKPPRFLLENRHS